MKSNYVITINYYKDKIKQEEIIDWYNTGKYIVYKSIDGCIKQVKLKRAISILLKENK